MRGAGLKRALNALKSADTTLVVWKLDRLVSALNI